MVSLFYAIIHGMKLRLIDPAADSNETSFTAMVSKYGEALPRLGMSWVVTCRQILKMLMEILLKKV